MLSRNTILIILKNDTIPNGVVVVFRDTELSDKIGFTYQNYHGEEAADDFIKSVLKYAPQKDEPDRLLTVILDGENAWESYRYDNDGKEFLNALYGKLTQLYESNQVKTVYSHRIYEWKSSEKHSSTSVRFNSKAPMALARFLDQREFRYVDRREGRESSMGISSDREERPWAIRSKSS